MILLRGLKLPANIVAKIFASSNHDIELLVTCLVPTLKVHSLNFTKFIYYIFLKFQISSFIFQQITTHNWPCIKL